MTADEKRRNERCRAEFDLCWVELRVLVAVLTHGWANGNAGVTSQEVFDFLVNSDEPIGHQKHVGTIMVALKRGAFVAQDKSRGMPYRWTATARGARLLGFSKEKAA